MSHSGADDALRLADCIKRFCRKRIDDVVRTNPLEPAVVFHMNDGWGALCASTTKAAIPGTHLVATTKGKFKHEFLLQRALVRTGNVFGAECLLAVVGEPEGLNKGKSTWNILTGCTRFMSKLRQMGHRGPCATIYFLDGALYTSMARKIHILHDLHYDVLPESVEPEMLRVMEFVYTLKCVSHGCNGGAGNHACYGGCCLRG